MMRRLHGGMKARDADKGTWQEMSSNELAQRLDNLPIPNAAVAADENGSVENWCDTIQSKALAVLGRASRHLQPALREWPPAKSLHRPPHRRRRQQSSILPLPPPCATASARDAERTGRPQKSFYHLRHRHRPPAPSEDQHQHRPPTLSPRDYHDRAAALQQKSPASDANFAEVYKHDGPQIMEHPAALFQEMWLQGKVPQDFKDATIIHLYKRIGNRQLCDNHRGIFLLNTDVINAAAQPLPKCPRHQRKFRARIGLVGHLRINCTSPTEPNFIPMPASSSQPPPNNSDNSSAPPLPSSSSSSSSSSTSTYSSPTVPSAAAQAAVSHINSDTTTDTTPTSPDSSDEDQD
nr:unnamed protein product [Spirometra erinaceieuropaei]